MWSCSDYDYVFRFCYLCYVMIMLLGSVIYHMVMIMFLGSFIYDMVMVIIITIILVLEILAPFCLI